MCEVIQSVLTRTFIKDLSADLNKFVRKFTGKIHPSFAQYGRI